MRRFTYSSTNCAPAEQSLAGMTAAESRNTHSSRKSASGMERQGHEADYVLGFTPAPKIIPVKSQAHKRFKRTRLFNNTRQNHQTVWVIPFVEIQNNFCFISGFSPPQKEKKSPLDETKAGGPSYVYRCKKIPHAR